MAVKLIASNRPFISKPWGWEDVLYNSPETNICMKVVFVKAGRSTEMFRHVKVGKLLALENGSVVVESLLGADPPSTRLEYDTRLRTVILSPGHAVEIEPNTWHRVCGIEDSYLYEATEHPDGSDDIQTLPNYAELTESAPLAGLAPTNPDDTGLPPSPFSPNCLRGG